jgi:glutaryl-CoA dehydrogenase
MTKANPMTDTSALIDPALIDPALIDTPAGIVASPLIDTSDLIDIESLLTPEEVALRASVRSFVDSTIRPNIAGWFEDGVFPLEIVPEMARLGLLGMHLKGYGCPGRSAVEYGLAALELEAGDSGLRTFVSVQGSLAMSAIHKHGSEEQKNEWLPKMAAGEAIGCFGLTEPSSGSDPSSMTTYARRDGDDWVITGTKRWIGLASVAQVAVIWAMTDDGVRGFVVPTETAGFTATVIGPKLSMRASIQCEIDLDNVRLPATAMLPKAKGLSGPFACLNEARYGIIWGVMGAARDSYLTALAYAGERMQFGKPLAGYQLTQEKLVDMALEINKGTLLALHLGRLKDAGTLQPHQISIGKLGNAREAIKICREARTVLGGNGITLDYSPLRHANNLESVRTYEGTDEVHTLVIGNHITGIPAFR